MRASSSFQHPQALRPVLASRPALRAHTEPPEPVMPPPAPPEVPTGVPPIGDPLPPSGPGPSPGPAPDMPPEITRPAQGGSAMHLQQGAEEGAADRAVHPAMMTQPTSGRAPRFERPSTFRRSLLRAMSGRLPDVAH